ncbi:phosphoketolase family protein [Rhodoligotrophos defluvii]|uniref:phosphoketolase family protein n=1 Tax=Rhodoligotrophos defluvii TaxID=2561934 RepID=UPI0010C973C5|nr:phosphoketolase family protein [Rhodoligotrophos defluvii]
MSDLAEAVSQPLSERELQNIHGYWCAANYLSVGQIYLLDNPLLQEELKLSHIKPRLLGHWGTTPGLNFVYAHLNRVVLRDDLDMIFICGPGHGGPAVVANTYLEGSYSEIYPEVSQDVDGMRRLFRQFSFPGGIPSHAAPETPGSIHEGGELGYALAHAFGAAFDNPELIVACVVGDGEAETGALAASWHSNKFLDPVGDGAVLPILHLNGYKIANPTILGRMAHDDLVRLFEGLGYEPLFVEGSDPTVMHQRMAEILDRAIGRIHAIQQEARIGGQGGGNGVPRWPMIILRSPKGWTGPHDVDGQQVEGFWRSHQVPLAGLAENPAHLKMLETWMRSYRPETLFDRNGRLMPELQDLAPKGQRRMGANPHANGGLLREPLDMPDFRAHGLAVERPGVARGEATRQMGRLLRDVIARNPSSFRLMGPDETTSNRLDAVFDVTSRVWREDILPIDVGLAPQGRVMEVLSEHLCQGWLEGYLLTGRHGLFSCYEAFIHIVDSMVNQHAKWLKVTRDLPWRAPISSLNYLLTSHVWRQDHNGFSHQDPGFIDHVVNKKAEIVRVYLPPDANTLLWVTDHCLRTYDRINVIVAGKQPSPQWLDMDQAIAHCEAGLGRWSWAGSEQPGREPDVVLACAGDVPTMEAVAAAQLLRQHLPEVSVRVVNVVDLMALVSPEEHPHGIPDEQFASLFGIGQPVIFAFHGYPQLIHRLTYKRPNHDAFHVHGYREEGTTTTPFDMVVLNRLDRVHLAMAAVKWLPQTGAKGQQVIAACERKLVEHHAYVRAHGRDMPEIEEWGLEEITH